MMAWPIDPNIRVAPSPLPSGPALEEGIDTTVAPWIGESPQSVALAELLSFQSSALTATQEDLSLVLGGRLNRPGLVASGNGRSRVLADKLVAEVAGVEETELAAFLDGADAWVHAPDPLQALKQQTGGDTGRMAWMLAAQLAHGNWSVRRRTRLRHALAALVDDDSLPLALFETLACDPLSGSMGLQQELRRLYHQSRAKYCKLSQWLVLLGSPSGRQRRLRSMIRVLSYELGSSGAPIVGSHLAAVIADLQWLLRLVGMEDHCGQAAELLNIATVDGEVLLHCLVALVEKIWIDAEGVGELLPPAAESARYRLVHVLGRLVQRLPLSCFSDAEFREQLIQAIAACRERWVEAAEPE